MNNYISPGEIMTFTAPEAGMDPEVDPGGTISGNAYLIGTLLVVATKTVAAGESFEGATRGVFTLPKATGEAWTEGALLYWNADDEEITTTAEDNTPVGCAAAVAESDATTGNVRLSGVPAEPVSLET